MRRLLFGGLLIAAVMTDASMPVLAKEKPVPESPLVQAIDRCRQITDPAQRLACYDAAAGALVTATNTGQVSVVDQSEVRKVRHSLFGFALPKVPFFTGDTTANEAQSRLDSTITSVRQLPSGYFRIVIADNNAVWQTTDSSISFDAPQAGQKITIIKGALGSYFLRINGQVGVRGIRVG